MKIIITGTFQRASCNHFVFDHVYLVVQYRLQILTWVPSY